MLRIDHETAPHSSLGRKPVVTRVGHILDAATSKQIDPYHSVTLALVRGYVRHGVERTMRGAPVASRSRLPLPR